jgi:hypothetical protein
MKPKNIENKANITKGKLKKNPPSPDATGFFFFVISHQLAFAG